MLKIHKHSKTKGRFITSLFQEFHVSNENDLYKKLIIESQTIPCMSCHKEYPIECIRFIHDNPYCLNCSR